MLTEALHYLGIESFEIPTVRIVCHRRHLYSLHVTRGVLAEVQRSISLSPRQKERVQGVGGNVRRLVPSPTRIVLKKTSITILLLLLQERNLSNFKTR